MEIRLIVNPHAGAGGAARKTTRIASLLREAGVHCEIAETKRAGHATDLAREASKEGVSVLGVVGGDGTLNEVAQAFIGSEGEPAPGPDLALFPAGTGRDFTRTFQLDADPKRCVERLLRAQRRPVDLGLTRLRGPAGDTVTRAFLNITSFGISGTVARLTNRGGKWLGGKLAFYTATTRATLGYRNAPVSLWVDGEAWHQGRIYTVAIANGCYFGGGMKIAPAADPSDGLLDCVLLGDMSRIAAVANTPRVYQGRHLELAQAKTTRGKRFRAEPWLTDEHVYVEVDGETPGTLPLEVELLPGAVTLRV